MKAIDFKLIHSFSRRKKLDRNGQGVIWVSAYQNPTHKYYNTGVRVTPEQWDTDRRKIIDHPNAVAYTTKIKRKLLELEELQISLINEKYGEHVSLHEFNERYRTTGGKKLSFCDFYEKAAKGRKDIGKDTRQMHLNTLRQFKTAVGNVPFNSLSYDTVEAFNNHLLDEEKQLTTIHKYHKHLKVYIRLAINKGLLHYQKNPYINFKYDRGKPFPRDFLSLAELQTLEVIPSEALTETEEVARDIFLLMAYTGLRISDAITITPSNFTLTGKNYLFSAIMQKGKKRLNKEIVLPIYAFFHFEGEEESKAQRWIKHCLKKYARGKHEALFSGISKVTVNKKLKIIAQKANLGKNLHSHVGRHSFGTNMIVINVPPTQLQQYMGHAKIETTMTYVHMSRKIQDKAMERIRCKPFLLE